MTLTSIINVMTDIVKMSVPVLLVFVLFYWNLSQIVFDSGSAEKRKNAITRMIWSIVALFFIFSLGGVISVIANSIFGPDYLSPGSGALRSGSDSSIPLTDPPPNPPRDEDAWISPPRN